MGEGAIPRAEAPTLSATPATVAEGDAGVPTRAGRYVVEGPIGRGGMATVYLARDEALQRHVALKLVRAPARRPEERARMLREAQSMALLEHPNIVQVFDTGECDEHIFIAMELVDGPNLAQWCAEQTRTLPELVAVFVQVARALAAVHARGLVHRDFKPHNAVVGADARVRLIDFGLARGSDTTPSREGDARPATASESTASGETRMRTDALTEVGLVLGTPAYMSPEQCRGREIGPASDQFSFCVALFEAIYGQRPFRGETRAELTQKICAGTIETPAGRAVPAWLDRIVRRGLAVDPQHRFPGMELLAARLEAGQRRPLALAAGIAATLAAVAVAWAIVDRPGRGCDVDPTLGGAWTPASRASLHDALTATGASYAEETATRIDAGVERYVERWQAARRDTCEDRDAIDDRILDTRLACLDRGRDELGRVLDMLRDADAAELERALRLVVSLESPAVCLDAEARSPDEVPPQLQPEVEAMLAELSRSVALRRLGRTHEAAEIDRTIVARAQELALPWVETKALVSLGFAQDAADDADGARITLERAYHGAQSHSFGALAADAAMKLADIASGAAQFDEAQRWLKHADAELARLHDPDRQRATFLDGQARLHHYAGRFNDAAEAFQSALEVAARVHGEDSEAVARTLDHLGSTYQALGEIAKAVDAHRRALAIFERVDGPRHPESGRAWSNLGNGLATAGRHDEAVVAYDTAHEILAAAYGEDHLLVATVLLGRGSAKLAERDVEAARADLLRALAIQEARLPSDDPSMGIVLNNLGNVELARDDPDAAERHFQRAHGLYLAGLGPSHPDTAIVLLNIARVAGAKGDNALAIQRYEAALVRVREAYGEEHPYVGMGLNNLAQQQLWAGELDPAKLNFERALAIAVATADSADPRVGFPRVGLAKIALAQGEHAAAIAGLEEVLQLWDIDTPSDEDRAEARLLLAETLAKTDADDDRVRDLARRARQDYVALDKREFVARADALLTR